MKQNKLRTVCKRCKDKEYDDRLLSKPR